MKYIRVRHTSSQSPRQCCTSCGGIRFRVFDEPAISVFCRSSVIRWPGLFSPWSVETTLQNSHIAMKDALRKQRLVVCTSCRSTYPHLRRRASPLVCRRIRHENVRRRDRNISSEYLRQDGRSRFFHRAPPLTKLLRKRKKRGYACRLEPLPVTTTPYEETFSHCNISTCSLTFYFFADARPFWPVKTAEQGQACVSALAQRQRQACLVVHVGGQDDSKDEHAGPGSSNSLLQGGH